MGKNKVKKEDFSKFSTGEIPVSTAPVDFPNRTGSSSAGHLIYAVNILALEYLGRCTPTAAYIYQ